MKLPYNTQVQAFNTISVNHTTKSVGIHLLPVCWLRPTTALYADEQSDTHERIADYTRKCAMKAWIAFKHTTGTHIQHSRGIILRIVFDMHGDVVISTSQSTKHRVTLFHYVVFLSLSSPLCSCKNSTTWYGSSCKITQNLSFNRHLI